MTLSARSPEAASIDVMIGNQKRTMPLTTEWQTLSFSAIPDSPIDDVVFALALDANSSLDVAGIQVDYGDCMSEYKRSSGQQGVYQKARFADDSLVLIATGYNAFKVSVAVHAKIED